MLRSELENVLEVREIDFLPEKMSHKQLNVTFTLRVGHFKHRGLEPSTYIVNF